MTPDRSQWDLVESLSHAPCLDARELKEVTAASIMLMSVGKLPQTTETRLRWLWEEKGRIGS